MATPPSRPPSPPASASRILAALLPPGDGPAVLRELAELFQHRANTSGSREARRWYRRQVRGFVWRFLRYGRRGMIPEGVSGPGSSGAGPGFHRRTGAGMAGWGSEIRQAARRLGRARGFTAIAVLTIGVGIGAFTSIFGLVDAVLLEPLPYDEPEELAWVWRDYIEAEFPRGWLAGPDVAGLATQPDVFEGVTALRTGAFNLSGVDGGDPVEIDGHLVTHTFFDVVGVHPVIGRAIAPEEDVQGAPPVTVISHDLWVSQFGSDPEVPGTVIQLDGVATEVIGVMPETFRFVKHGSLVDPAPAALYVPMQTDLALASPYAGSYAALVRIPGEVTDDRVTSALAQAIEPTNELSGADGGSTIRLWTVGLSEDLVSGVRPAIVALAASAGFLLLILAANLATLLISRAAAREREIGVRKALGAGSDRLFAGVAAETALLAGLGCAVGLAVAWFGIDLVVLLAPADLPRLASVALDGSMVGIAVAVTAAMALAAGTAPALYAIAGSAGDALREGGTRSAGGVRGTRTRSLLVTGQVALSLMLLVGAGLTTRAFAQLMSHDAGFDPGATLTFRVPLTSAEYPGNAQLAFHDELRTQLGAIPGVVAVGSTDALPLDGSANQAPAAFPDAPGNIGDELADRPLIDVFRITPGYIEAAGYRLLEGRGFTALDGDTTTFNAIIDDVLARRFFPGGSAVGHRLAAFGDTAIIVGVVDQARHYRVETDDRGQVYIPFALAPITSMSYAVRTRGDASSLIAPARDRLRTMDAAVPMAEVRELESLVTGSLDPQRLSLTLLLALAGGALLLAALGIYGVVSNMVVRRTREIGLRIALGAARERVVGLVIRQGLKLVVFGGMIGLIAAVGSARFLERMVIGIEPDDPLVYLGVATGLVLVASIASYIPARQASRIDPVESLRRE